MARERGVLLIRHLNDLFRVRMIDKREYRHKKATHNRLWVAKKDLNVNSESNVAR